VPQSEKEHAVNNDTVANEVDAVLEAVRRGYLDRDPAAITKQFTADAEIFDLAPPLARSIDARQIADWLATWSGPVETTPLNMKLTVSGDAAFCHGFIRVRARTKDGEDTAWWTRATTCLVRREGQWKIVHQHTSVPFYMDGSFRAAMDLAP
jgi:ketosteroid isomerase-like protein